MTLVELLVALGLGVLMIMGVAAAMNHFAASTEGMRQNAEFSTLMTDLRFFLMNEVNCTQNLKGTRVPVPPASQLAQQVPINATSQLTFQTGLQAGKVFVMAGWRYPAGQGPLYINNSGGTNPGLALQYKGTLTSNASNNGGTELVDFVVNAARVGTFFGSPIMSHRLPLVASVDGSGMILDCFAQSGIVVKYVMDDICANNSGGAATYNPSTNTCTSMCYPGGTNTASCPGGMMLTSCGSVGGSDPNAQNFMARPYPGAPAYGFPNVQTKMLGTSSCYCSWATDLPPSDYGQCEACCVPI